MEPPLFAYPGLKKKADVIRLTFNGCSDILGLKQHYPGLTKGGLCR